MLHILIFILKLFGWILLSILGLLLVSVLLFLLVPIRYQVKSSYYGALKGSAKVTWLFGLLSVNANYENDVALVIRLFGFKLSKSSKKTIIKKSKEKVEDIKETTIDTIKVDNKVIEHKPAKTDEPSPPLPEAEPNGSLIKRIWQMIKQFFKNLWMKFKEFIASIKRARKTLENVKEFFTNEENKKTFRLLKKQYYAFLRHLKPKKWSINARFGFDDPYTTGRLITFASIGYPFYHKHITLIPLFDRVIFEGELFVKGRIRFGTMLILGIRVLFDKNFRKLIKKWIK